MVTAKQVKIAHLQSRFLLCVTVCVCFALLYLRFVDADVVTLFGVFFLYFTTFGFTYKLFKRARTLASQLSIRGALDTSPLRPADPLFHSTSLPSPERPPRSTHKN
jgi:hypothetical protein